jgi:hypothetical protein
MNIQEREHWDYEANRMSAGEYDRAECLDNARWADNWRDEWVLSDRDVWYKNPVYQGPAGLHPDQDDDDWSEEQHEAYRVAYAAYVEREEWWDSVMSDPKALGQAEFEAYMSHGEVGLSDFRIELAERQ